MAAQTKVDKLLPIDLNNGNEIPELVFSIVQKTILEFTSKIERLKRICSKSKLAMFNQSNKNVITSNLQ